MLEGIILILFILFVLAAFCFWIGAWLKFIELSKDNIGCLFFLIMPPIFFLASYIEDNTILGEYIYLVGLGLIITSLLIYRKIRKKRKQRYEYIKENFYHALKNRYHYVEDYDSCSNKRIREILSIDLDIWEEEEKIEKKFNEIKKKYPNGLRIWKKRTHVLSSKEVINYENEIELCEKEFIELQEREKIADSFTEWENEQANYSSTSRRLNPKNFGCYYYDIDFDCITKEGNTRKGSYRVWQHFTSSFYYDIEPEIILPESLNYLVHNACRVPVMVECMSSYNDSVYEEVFELVRKHKEEFGDITVIWGNSDTSPSDALTLNEFHFGYLRHRLNESDIRHYEIDDIKMEYLKRNIIVIEFATFNDDLKKTCSAILKKYSDIRPLITYISINKEFDEDEIKNLISRENEKIKQEKELIASLKSPIKYGYIPNRSTLQCFSLYNYYPTTCDFEATQDEWDIRNLIWDFKANPNKPEPTIVTISRHNAAMGTILPIMVGALRFFYGDKLSKVTLVCIPSSKQVVNERRYKTFSERLCKETGMENGYGYIKVETDGEASHLGGSVKAQYLIDEKSVKDKFIILFDDVITSGKSIEYFNRKLTDLGATVIAGFSIGKTRHERQPHHPIEQLNLTI